MDQEDITPEGSAAPVYLDEAALPVEGDSGPSPMELIAVRSAERQQGIDRLVSEFGFTPEQAAALAGG